MQVLNGELSDVNEVKPLDLRSIDPARIDNVALRSALERIKERSLPDPHASYHTKHSSHNRYSKGW